jgi:hypothetical protein
LTQSTGCHPRCWLCTGTATVARGQWCAQQVQLRAGQQRSRGLLWIAGGWHLQVRVHVWLRGLRGQRQLLYSVACCRCWVWLPAAQRMAVAMARTCECTTCSRLACAYALKSLPPF